MEIKYLYYNPERQKKTVYDDMIDTKTFSSVNDAKEFINKNPNILLDRLMVERGGVTELLVASVFKGDEDSKFYGIPHLSQEDSNRYRPYQDGYEIFNRNVEFLDITSIYMNRNSELKINKAASEALYEIKKPTSQSIAGIRDKFQDTTETKSNKLNV